ncbi:hypothetical protein CBR_g45773 [Chara braunii]|uniref:DUF659 domain-containing protein n=1 Tax=Chara braunii TaxID=69332 RepID=A0A388LZC7_CHABU|nr:hypothetical protein CBR_g45773 [Chara braunii]|eukprot:GBG87621.1 hypothetical protein CBR_g45773 [Chara braunii]
MEHFCLKRVSARCPNATMTIWRRLHRVGFEMPPDLMERVQCAIEETASDDDDGPVLEDDAVGRGGGVAMDGEAGEAVHGEAGSGVDDVTRGVVADGETPVRRPALQADIDDTCCEFFVENAIPFNAAKSKSFKKLQLACYGPQPAASCPLVPTGYNPLRCRLLDRLRGRLEAEDKAVRDDWEATGCTFITDGTTDICGRSLMNYILVGRLKPIFIKCEDVSEGEKDAAAVIVGWKRFFREWGVEKVTAICIDSFAGNKSAARMLREDPEFAQIYWIPCTAHCMDLLMHDICKKEWSTTIIEKANKVVGHLLQSAQVATIAAADAVFEAVVERLIGKRGSKTFDDCLDQLYEFQMARGVFGTTRAAQRAKKDNAVLWWEAHGAGHPEIKALAVKVLSIWTTSSPAERNWSTWSLVQTKSRNKLHHQRTEKLVYSDWSLRLKSRGDDDPTVVGGWLGLEADWADDDLVGDQAGLTDAVDDGELGHEAAPSGAGSTTIRNDPAAAGISAGVPRRGEVEEGMEWGDMEEEEDDDDVDSEDEIPHDEWVDDRSDSDRSWTRREEITPYVQRYEEQPVEHHEQAVVEQQQQQANEAEEEQQADEEQQQQLADEEQQQQEADEE